MLKTTVISLLIVSLIIGIGLGYVISPEYAKQSIIHSNNIGNADENYDLRFIDVMIEHHEGAILKAHDAKAKSNRKEILDLAGEIINTQQKEIDMLKKWRAEWYGNK